MQMREKISYGTLKPLVGLLEYFFYRYLFSINILESNYLEEELQLFILHKYQLFKQAN